MTEPVSFTVAGIPVPQGSMRSFERNGRTITKAGNAGALERWRGDIREASGLNSRPAIQRNVLPFPAGVAVAMRLRFRFPRPKGHYLPANSKRPEPVLRPDAPRWMTSKPDGDKLDRAVLDALTSLAYDDDAQVVARNSTKRYADPGEEPGVDLDLEAIP